MAEYLGEKLTAVKQVRGAQREVLQKECADLILKLWDRRHHLPQGTRPLESYEPLFVVLNELSLSSPRYSVLRDLPQTNKNSAAGKIIQGVLAIDRSATALIWYYLAEAVGTISKKDRRWAKILTEIKPSPWDIQIVLATMEDAESLSNKQERMNRQQREKLKTMLTKLDRFEKLTVSLRALLEEKIKASK